MSTSLCAFEDIASLQGDIAGPILRVLTYCKFKPVAAVAVSPASNEIYHRVFPLIVVNVFILASALIFGCSPSNEIHSLSVIVAWIFTMGPTSMLLIVVAKLRQDASPTGRMYRQSLYFVILFSFLDVLLVVFSLTAYHHPEQFGIGKDCHEATRALIIRAFSVNHSWILTAIMLGSIIHCSMLSRPTTRLSLGQLNRAEEQQIISQGHEEIIEADYGWGVKASVLLVIVVFFTENMIAGNFIAPPDGSFWTVEQDISQILPLLLVAVPLTIPRRQLLNLERHDQKTSTYDP